MSPNPSVYGEYTRAGDSMKGRALLRLAWAASACSLVACGDTLVPLKHVPSAHAAPKTPSTDTSAPSKPVIATLSASSPAHALIRVSDPSTVCMVNNRYMGAKQIPVAVEGKTYFGCCEMCKGRLERDRSTRLATDPVNGQPVDKATAVIGRDGSNNVFYFENETTFHRFGGG